MKRCIVSPASFVCIVQSTRWPVSAPRIAVIAVSSSRISPTRITSASWRSAPRSASRLLGASTPTSRWVMIALPSRWMNSIGSSTVTMWQGRCSLTSPSRTALVVLLPEPVGPVTKIRPRFSFAQARTVSGRLSPSGVGASETTPEDERGRAALAVHGDAVALVVRVIGEVGVALALVLLALDLGLEELVLQEAGVLGPDRPDALERDQLALDPCMRHGGNLEMEIGATEANRLAQGRVQVERHALLFVLSGEGNLRALSRVENGPCTHLRGRPPGVSAAFGLRSG